MHFFLSFFLSGGLNAQIRVNTNGKIGIGTTNPGADIEIETSEILFDMVNSYNPSDLRLRAYYGDVHFLPSVNYGVEIGQSSYRFNYGYFNYIRVRHTTIVDSDKKFKENITSLDKAMDKVLKLNGVKYNIKDEYLNERDKKNKKEQIGLIANDVMEVVPEVVCYDSVADAYGIQYESLIPILIEAIKEQHAEIEKLKGNTKLKSTESANSFNSPVIANLSKNKPNPFNTETTIEFYLATEIGSATLYIYDLQGKQLKSMDIVQREQGSVIVYANELLPGMYKYALIADGNLIGTETMILTE